MEVINGVLQSLNIDQTVFYQFGIFFVIFFVLHIIFFERLQEVIELREERTTKLKKLANEKFAQAKELAGDYRDKIAQANTEGQKIFNRHKREVLEEEQIRLKGEEKALGLNIEKQRKEFESQLMAGKRELFEHSDSLAEEVVNKVTI